MSVPVFNLSSLDGSNGFRLDSDSDFDGLDISVSSAGDVNGDGFDDVIVNSDSTDSSYVVFGKASGFDAHINLSSLDGSNGFRLRPGETVGNAGDVNGDGFSDVIVGVPFADTNSGYFSYSYVVFGKASGFDAQVDLSSLDGHNGFRLDSDSRFDGFGNSVSSVGDINGDGFDDVIVGAPDAGVFGTSYVVFGKASDFAATLNVSNLVGHDGFSMGNGPLWQAAFGSSVSNAGDVNGDGFDDVIVGAPFYEYHYNYGADGSSYVIFGKTSDFSATLDVSSLDGSNGFRLAGETYSESGQSVSSAGDVNGDGLDDVIIGAPYATSAITNDFFVGAGYVVFGKASGFAATLDLSNLDGHNGFTLEEVKAGYSLGYSVSSAGDVNGDGFDDVIIGAPSASLSGYHSSGSSYVVFGRASGFDAHIDLSNLDSKSGFRLDGENLHPFGGQSGRSVSSAGDVNGDGFGDLLIGARGARYVIFGSRDFGGGGGGNVIAGTPGNDVLKGTLAADIFEAGDGNDKMTGRGGADVFHGGAGDDYIQVADLGFGSVDGGSGNDVLHLAGNGLNFNLADSGANIHGIETLCLYGRGDNTLTLTAADLLNLSDTSNTLRVNGNAAGHIVVEDNGWVDEGPRGSGYYHVYTHDDAVLLVGQNVTVDFV